MNKYPKIHWTNEYFTHICKSFTAKRKIIRLKAKNHLAQNEEKQCGKKPKNVPKTKKDGLKTARQKPERMFRNTFGNYRKSIRQRLCTLPERHVIRPSRPAFRQKGSLSPHSLTNRKPQNRWESFIFLHGPTRPQMNDSHGEKLTFWHSVWRSSFTSTTGSLCWPLLKCNTEQTSRDTTKKDRLRIYPEAVLSTLLYRYSLLV